MTTSFVWRSGTTSLGNRGLRTQGDASVITFTAGTVTDGVHTSQTNIDLEIGIGINEKPKGNINEIQDTFVDGITWTITGFAENAANNPVGQTVKEWIMEAKTNTVFTKGRFGIEMPNFPDYDVIPITVSASPTQPRGLILTNWQWIRPGETEGKVEFVATVRLNGDSGTAGTSPKFDWTVVHP